MLRKVVPFLLSIAFMIHASNVYAVDIPDIRLLNSTQIKLERKIKFKSGVGHLYCLKCHDKKAKEYAEAYIKFLTTELSFEVSEQYKEHYFFSNVHQCLLIYKGSENIPPIKNSKHSYHVKVDFIGKDTISVAVATGINMITKQTAKPSSTNSPSNSNITNSDVPDFLDVCNGKVSFKNSQKQSSGNNMFFYECSLNTDLNNDFASKYVALITTKYNFRLLNHTHEKKGKGDTWDTDSWYFVYTGDKSNVLSPNKNYHLKLHRNRFTAKSPVFANMTKFEIEVAQNLIYSDKTAAPKAKTSNGQVFCPSCSGSGKCSICNGEGHYSIWKAGELVDQSCGACLTTGKCSDCNGTGYVN